MYDLARNVFAVIGALVVAVFLLGAALWARTGRKERRNRLPDLPPPGDPAWDRLFDALLEQDQGEKP